MRKPKKDPKTAADAAEARAKGKGAKPPVAKKEGPAVTAARKNPEVDQEARALFLNHLPKIADLKKKLNTANSNLRNAYKTAKADGYLKTDFEVAFEMQGDGGEKTRKAAIARQLTIAKWLGCDLGNQLDLFVEDERVPAVDRAYEEGKTDSFQNIAARPSYAPDTEQYRQYMKGFHDATEQRVKGAGGIGKLHPAVAEDLRETAAKKAEREASMAKDAEAFKGDVQTSGVAMTRSQLKEQQVKADGGSDLKH